MHNKSFRGKEGGVHAPPPKKKKERKKISEGSLAQDLREGLMQERRKKIGVKPGEMER